MKHLRLTVMALVVFCSQCGVFAFSPPAALQPLYLTGMNAPGIAGQFIDLGRPIINENGEIGFGTFLAGAGIGESNDHCVWLHTAEGLQFVAREGDPAPGTNLPFGQFYHYILNDQSQFVLGGDLQLPPDSTIPDGYSTWFGSLDSGLELLASPSTSVAGAPPEFLDSSAPRALNNHGEVFLWTRATDLFDSRERMMIVNQGSYEIIASTGDPAPGADDGITIYKFGRGMLNDDRQVVFNGYLDDPEANNMSLPCIWSADSSGVRPVAVTGQPVPGYEQSATWGSMIGNPPSMNEHGEGAFVGQLIGEAYHSPGDLGIWRMTSDSVQQVMFTGDPAPPPHSGQLSMGTPPLIDGQGRIIAAAGIDQGYGGLWIEDHGVLKSIVLRGQYIPEYGVTIESLPIPVAINAKGQVVFRALVTNAPSNRDYDLWAYDPDSDELYRIVQNNSWMILGPDDLRQVDDFDLIWATNGQDGLRSSLNNQGQLVVNISFTDGSEGIFTTVIPEPSSLLVALTGVVALMRYRR